MLCNFFHDFFIISFVTNYSESGNAGFPCRWERRISAFNDMPTKGIDHPTISQNMQWKQLLNSITWSRVMQRYFPSKKGFLSGHPPLSFLLLFMKRQTKENKPQMVYLITIRREALQSLIINLTITSCFENDWFNTIYSIGVSGRRNVLEMIPSQSSIISLFIMYAQTGM